MIERERPTKYNCQACTSIIIQHTMKYVFYFLLIAILSSCGENLKKHYPRYVDFPETIHRQTKVISIDTALFRYPFRIRVKDSIALILDLHHPDYYFHAFTYPAWKPIVSFGRRGEGPDEMLSAETFRFVSSDSIWALDANKMQLTRWHIRIADGTAMREEAIDLDKELVRALDFQLTRSGFLIPDYLGEHRFRVTDLAGHPVSSGGYIPTEQGGNEVARPALAQAWRSFIDLDAGRQLLVMASQLGEVLEIYHLDGDSSQVVYGPHGEPEFQVRDGYGIPTGIMGFSDVQITDRYIYAVFHGRSFREINASYDRGIKPEDGGHFIYVFDLDGRPVRQYMLDRAIYGIDVHEAEGVIYATDVNRDEPIVEIKLV